MRRFFDNSGLLISGTIAALAWANIDPASYERFTPGLHFVVNEARGDGNRENLLPKLGSHTVGLAASGAQFVEPA